MIMGNKAANRKLFKLHLHLIDKDIMKQQQQQKSRTKEGKERERDGIKR